MQVSPDEGEGAKTIQKNDDDKSIFADPRQDGPVDMRDLGNTQRNFSRELLSPRLSQEDIPLPPPQNRSTNFNPLEADARPQVMENATHTSTNEHPGVENVSSIVNCAPVRIARRVGKFLGVGVLCIVAAAQAYAEVVSMFGALFQSQRRPSPRTILEPAGPVDQEPSAVSRTTRQIYTETHLPSNSMNYQEPRAGHTNPSVAIKKREQEESALTSTLSHVDCSPPLDIGSLAYFACASTGHVDQAQPWSQ